MPDRHLGVAKLSRPNRAGPPAVRHTRYAIPTKTPKAPSGATRSTVIEALVKQGQLRPQRHIPHARAYPITATADEPVFRTARRRLRGTD